MADERTATVGYYTRETTLGRRMEEAIRIAANRDRWSDVYGFQSIPSPHIDLETSNWWVSTHPGSPFVSGLIVAAQDGDSRRTFGGRDCAGRDDFALACGRVELVADCLFVLFLG